jgi:hypothetical protein
MLPEQDALEVRVRFTYLETERSWGEPPSSAGADFVARGGRPPLHVAPVPPLLMLAQQAGLPVRFSKPPRDTGCTSSVGPWFVVPDAAGYSYAVPGLSSCITEALADLPPGSSTPPVDLARHAPPLAAEAAKIPFWTSRGGEQGHLAAEALLRSILWPADCQYELDPVRGCLRAADGFLWQHKAEGDAVITAADHLRAGWYAGLYADLWPLLGRRWHHLQSLHAALASPGDWATLDLGAGSAPLDARLNAAIFYARLAARLAPPDEYAAAHLRAAKLLIAAYALTAGAPTYAAQHGPWPTLAGFGVKPTALSRCAPGSLGLSPGPPPLVTDPCDAGYRFASRFLSAYFREKFRGGPFGLFGRSPEEWAQRTFAAIQAPDLAKKPHPVRPEPGPYTGNYTYTVEPGPDGWPALVWASHRAPAGGSLLFGTIGTGLNTRGKLVRSVTLSPGLRLSAYEASEVPPPPTETAPPAPPPPRAPSAGGAADTPAPPRPRSTPDSAPGKGAPAK